MAIEIIFQTWNSKENSKRAARGRAKSRVVTKTRLREKRNEQQVFRPQRQEP